MPPNQVDILHAPHTEAVLRGRGSESQLKNAAASNVQTEAAKEAQADYKMEIVWPNVFKFALLHIFAFAGICCLPWTSWQKMAVEFVLFNLSCLVSIKRGLQVQPIGSTIM